MNGQSTLLLELLGVHSNFCRSWRSCIKYKTMESTIGCQLSQFEPRNFASICREKSNCQNIPVTTATFSKNICDAYFCNDQFLGNKWCPEKKPKKPNGPIDFHTLNFVKSLGPLGLLEKLIAKLVLWFLTTLLQKIYQDLCSFWEVSINKWRSVTHIKSNQKKMCYLIIIM